MKINYSRAREVPPPEKADDFAERFVALIQSTGLTQQQFAVRLNAASGFVSDVARGVKKPGYEFLFKLRAAFGVSVDWLLDGSGTMRGEGSIALEAFHITTALSALAVAARVHGDATAGSLLGDMLNGRRLSEDPQDDLGRTLPHLVEQSTIGVMSAVTYNSQLLVPMGRQRFLGSLRNALTLCDSYVGRSPLQRVRSAFGAATLT